MKGPVEIIQLEPDDDVISVRDRIGFAESHRVLLLWPPNGEPVLQRKLDLILLQRAVRRRAGRLALVTRDRGVIANAADLNISTFNTVEESRRERWRRGRLKVFVDRSDRPLSEPDPGELQEVATRLRMAPTASQLRLRRSGRALLLLLVMGLVVGAALLILPSATLTLTPARERLEISVRVTADPAASAVDLENSLIPSTILRVEIEQTAAVETTGNRDVAPTAARGTVVFTNSGGQAVTIPAGTTVNTSTGAIVRFRTLDAVTLPAEVNAIAVVAVEALPDFAGPVGNVPAGAINFIDGPLNDLLTVENTDPTGGGYVPVNRLVAAADHERLTAAVRGAIQQRAYVELTAMLGDFQTIIPESIRITETRPEWTTFSAEIDAEADSVSLTMRAVVSAVVLDERLINQAAYAGLAQQIPAGKIVTPESISFERGPVESIDENGRTRLQTTVHGEVATALDTGAVRQAIRGMGVDEAAAYAAEHLDLAPGTAPAVTTWPEFYRRMPFLASRITITLQETP